MAEYGRILKNYFFIRHYMDDLTWEQKANLKKSVEKKDADKETIRFFDNLQKVEKYDKNDKDKELKKLTDPSAVENLSDLYRDLLIVFENIRKDKEKVNDDLYHEELHKDVIAFEDKYGSIFVRKQIPVGVASGQINIRNLKNWIDNVPVSDGKPLKDILNEQGANGDYVKLKKALDESERKNKITDEALNLINDVIFSRLGEYNEISGDVLNSRTNITVRDLLNVLNTRNEVESDKLDEFRGNLKGILDTIYAKSKVADYVAGHGGSEIVDAKTTVKEKNDFSNVPNDYKYESGMDRLRNKIKETKEKTIYKLEQRHYRHSYLNANAKSIVSSLIKKKITPDQGLEAWLKEKDAIINSVSPAAKDDCTKMFKFFEKVKGSDEKLITKALSEPDRLDALVSFLIKDAVNGTDGMSVGTAKAIMESLFVMRYRLFDFAGRGSKMKEFWDSKTQLVSGMSLFKGNEGAEIIGKMTDWTMKLCMSAVINGFAALMYGGKSLVKGIRKTGEKNIKKEKEVNNSKQTQIQELWDYWNSIDKEDGVFNWLPFKKIEHQYH